MTSSSRAYLVLEGGLVFEGRPLGHRGVALGEVVFNTAMAGYQEVLTDPSYAGQIVAMTCPHIGNTGINPEDGESARVHLAGFVVHEASRRASSWRATETLDAFLRRHRIVGLDGVDTRRLTVHLRDRGAQRAAIGSEGTSPRDLLDLARRAPSMVGRDLATGVMATAAEVFSEAWDPGAPARGPLLPGPRRLRRHPTAIEGPHVVLLDFGIKAQTVRELAHRGCRVTVVPGTTAAADVLALRPAGVLIGNGPGDPAALEHVRGEIGALLGTVPLFGICLGHQLLALALGGRTYKLDFGHHGTNHPVQECATGRVEITSQNHGFAVDPESFPRSVDVRVSHISLYDRTCEGLEVPELKAFSVQFHPEAAPGPRDGSHLFDRFVAQVAAVEPAPGRS